MLKNANECFKCDFKGKAIFEDKEYVSCPHIRVAESLKINTILPFKLSKRKVFTVEELVGTPNPKILLVRKGGGLGDIVSTTVVIRGVREKFPDADIFYYCAEKYRGLLEGNPDLNGIITEKPPKDNYELEIELDNPCPCYVYEAKNIDNPEGITTPRIDLFCERAGVNPDDKMPSVRVNEKESEWVKDFFRKGKVKSLKIAIAPISFEMMKSWPADKAQQLASKIAKQLNATVFILHDRPLGIKDAVGIYGYPLGKVMALVNKMDLVVSVDTGFIHLAAALGRPLIGLWGVTPPKRVMTYYKHTSWIWKKKKFPCSPCYYLHKCMKIPSPCMDAITPDEVFDEVKKRLSHKSA